MLLTLVYSTYGIATKNLIFVFRTSLAQNAKYFRRKGIGLLLPGSSHLQRGRFNPQSQLFGQMKIFLSLYNFFFKKFQTWILSQMTPVSTFFERPDLSGRTLQPSKSTFWWKLQFSLEMAFFFAFFNPTTPSTENASNPKVNFLVKWRVFSQCIIFEKVSKFETLWGGGVSSVLEGLKNVKKRNFERKLQIWF